MTRAKHFLSSVNELNKTMHYTCQEKTNLPHCLRSLLSLLAVIWVVLFAARTAQGETNKFLNALKPYQEYLVAPKFKAFAAAIGPNGQIHSWGKA